MLWNKWYYPQIMLWIVYIFHHNLQILQDVLELENGVRLAFAKLHRAGRRATKPFLCKQATKRQKIKLATRSLAMTAIRNYTTSGNNVYVGQFRIGNTAALMYFVFGVKI
jgi:hypothetical protein